VSQGPASSRTWRVFQDSVKERRPVKLTVSEKFFDRESPFDPLSARRKKDSFDRERLGLSHVKISKMKSGRKKRK